MCMCVCMCVCGVHVGVICVSVCAFVCSVSTVALWQGVGFDTQIARVCLPSG